MFPGTTSDRIRNAANTSSVIVNSIDTVDINLLGATRTALLKDPSNAGI